MLLLAIACYCYVLKLICRLHTGHATSLPQAHDLPCNALRRGLEGRRLRPRLHNGAARELDDRHLQLLLSDGETLHLSSSVGAFKGRVQGRFGQEVLEILPIMIRHLGRSKPSVIASSQGRAAL